MNAAVREIADSLGAVKVLLLQDDRDGAMEILNRYKLIFPDGAPSIAMPPPAGRWTTNAPTAPGWYWFENSNAEVEVVEIYRSHPSGVLYAHLPGLFMPLAEVEGAWYSEPLSVPPTNGEKL